MAEIINSSKELSVRPENTYRFLIDRDSYIDDIVTTWRAGAIADMCVSPKAQMQPLRELYDLNKKTSN